MKVLVFLPLAHLIVWLLSKGTIWVALELFNVNWYGKFWAVYVMIWILSLIFSSGSPNFKRD